MSAVQFIELLSQNKNQAFIGLTKSKMVQEVLSLCTMNEEIKLKFKGPSAMISRSIFRILANITQRSEARLQLLSSLNQKEGEPLYHLVELMKTHWESLDPYDRTELVTNGFKALKQLTLGPGIVQRIQLLYPHLIQDLSDLIMQNVDQPQVLKEVKGLLHNYRLVTALPESLEALLREYQPDPYVEMV